MKETLLFLKKDRQVNDSFINRLKKVGLEIQYGTYSYWDGQGYIKIGTRKVWLVEEKYSNHGNSCSCVCRYQNDVIKEIYQVIREEKKIAEERDKFVEYFFEKLNT